MDVIDIVNGWLKEHGYTGLVDEYRECGCAIDDLAPCDNIGHHCSAGYKVACTPDCEHGDGYEKGNWHVQLKKPEEKAG